MTEEQARNHPGVLAGTHYCFRNKSKLGGWTTENKTARARYERSPKGKAALARYAASEKGQVVHDRYEYTPSGIKARIKANANQRGV